VAGVPVPARICNAEPVCDAAVVAINTSVTAARPL